MEILIFAVFGGSEILWGPVFGASFLTLMPELLRGLSEYRYMIYGIILVLMMIFRPQGLIDANLIHWLKGRRDEGKSCSLKSGRSARFSGAWPP